MNEKSDDTAPPKVYLRRWNPKTMVSACVSVLQGKRKSGKTVLAQYLMEKISPMFSGGVLFSGTEKLTPCLGRFLHPNVVHDGLNVPMFKALVENRVQTIGNYNASISHKQITENKQNRQWSTLIIMEDCLKNYKHWNSISATFDLFFNGRHADFGLMLLTQEAKAIPPSCRGNAEYLFLFQEINPRNLDVLYNVYCSFIPKNVFYQLMEKVGKQYHCIVIDFSVKSSNIWQDKVFWYKAELNTNPVPFRFGSKESWDYNDRIVQERAQAIYEKAKKEKQAKKEMAEWIDKLNDSSRAKQGPTAKKQKMSDRFF